MNDNIKQMLINEAKKAFKKNEVPVGAIVVKENKIMAKAHNNRQKKCNVTGHAEINAIIKAEKKLKDWRLDGCELYVTLEPCDMCKKIIEESRINNVYYMLPGKRKINRKDVCYKQIKPDKKIENMFNKFFKNLR